MVLIASLFKSLNTFSNIWFSTLQYQLVHLILMKTLFYGKYKLDITIRLITDFKYMISYAYFVPNTSSIQHYITVQFIFNRIVLLTFSRVMVRYSCRSRWFKSTPMKIVHKKLISYLWIYLLLMQLRNHIYIHNIKKTKCTFGWTIMTFIYSSEVSTIQRK